MKTIKITNLAKSIGYAVDHFGNPNQKNKNIKSINCAMCNKKVYKPRGNQKYCNICKSEAVINNLRKMGQINFD